MKDAGAPGPFPALDNKPEPPKEMIYYIEHFYKMIKDRGYEQGSPLPLANWQIKAYFNMFGLEDFLEFYDSITMLDSIYLKVQSEESERKRKQDEQKSKSTSRSKSSPKRPARR